MKKWLSLSFALMLVHISTAQTPVCTADTAQYRNRPTAIYPLPYEATIAPNGGITLPACLNKPYRWVFTVNVKDSIDISGVMLPMDSLRIPQTGSISGLPTGLTYACNPPSCSFYKNTMGCIAISGTVANTNAVANYEVSILGTLTAQGTPIEQTFPGALFPGSYRLRLLANTAVECGGTNSIDDVIAHFSMRPNPANDVLDISFEQNKYAKLDFTITDMQGNIFINQKNDDDKGTKNHKIDISNLPNAVYFLKITDGQNRLIKKFVVLH